VLLAWKILLIALATFGHVRHSDHRVRESLPAQPKARAEQTILRVALRYWRHPAARAGLVDARSGLLRNNVRAICHGQGRQIGDGYHRFRCVMQGWPSPHGSLVISYDARGSGAFRVRLVHSPASRGG
jgi:hypothetical protein